MMVSGSDEVWSGYNWKWWSLFKWFINKIKWQSWKNIKREATTAREELTFNRLLSSLTKLILFPTLTIHIKEYCQLLKSVVDKNLIWNSKTRRWKGKNENFYFIFSIIPRRMFRTIFFISSSANKKFETLSQKIILFHQKCWGSNKYCGIYKLQCCYDGQFFKTFQTFTIFHLLQNSYFPDTRCHWFIELCWILEVCEGKQCKLCESGSLCQHNNNEQQDMLASDGLVGKWV